MNEFSKKDAPELKKLLADKREALRVFRFEGAGSRTRNVRAGRELRRDIARILTELHKNEISHTK